LRDHEVIFKVATSGDRTMLLNANKVMNGKNGEELILLSFEDVSERRNVEKAKKEFSEELERKVKERTRQLEQLNMQLDQFAHTTSHEFQEPLRKIMMFSNLLQEKEKLSDPVFIKKYLNKIEGASLRMTKLINDTLNFASVTHYEKLFEKTDLNQILKNIVYDFELLIQEKKAKIIARNLPILEAVPFQMNQLFYDLVDNALKFSRKDPTPVIEISSRQLSKKELASYPKLDQHNNHYELVFKDNGIGFNQKYASKIFTMFQRLSPGGKYAGMGIGLAICKKTVEQYNGEIFAVGKENEGASFYLILPAKQPTQSK